jgi:hypothetical protein
VTEGGQLSFTVTRSGVTTTAVTASYASADGTASSTSDYTPVSNTVSFAANDTSETITVNTTNDSSPEANETLTVTLSNPSSGAAITTAVGTGTINDNDYANLAIGNASVTEGGQLSFTVTRSGVTTSAVSASYASASGTATSGTDFTPVSGTVSFIANDTSETITVNTTNDSAAESNETMTVTLSSPSSGAAITTAVGTGTINDNDFANLAINDTSVTEGGQLVFTVTRSGVTTNAVSASYASSSGTATSGSDFTGVSGTVSFVANDTSETITVNTTNDSTSESNETMTVTLSSPSSGAAITDGSGTGTINDNDSTIVLTTTGAPWQMSVLSAHSGTYQCTAGNPAPGNAYEVCYVPGQTGTAYSYTQNNGQTTYAPGYSLTTNGELQVEAAYYGTAQ